jgi:5'-nucleotidase
MPEAMRVLLTNDDGIDAEGLQALRRALRELPDVELAVIAPDGNRSATARSITTRRPLWVERVEFDDGSHGFATDGTPVDCVRLMHLGLIDDITYSGTVAAAFEALLLGLPGIAVSQQSTAREMDFRLGAGFDFERGAAFVARLVQEVESVPLPPGTLLNVNVPGGEPHDVEVTRLGKRIYEDVLELQDEQHPNRRLFRIYGDAGGLVDEDGTDIAAVAAGRIAVTPIHFDLTDRDGLSVLREHDLARLLAPAAREVE